MPKRKQKGWKGSKKLAWSAESQAWEIPFNPDVLAENAVAISDMFHTAGIQGLAPDYRQFYDNHGEKLGGFPGGWIEAMGNFVNAIIHADEPPNKRQLLRIAITINKQHRK